MNLRLTVHIETNKVLDVQKDTQILYQKVPSMRIFLQK